MDGHDLMSCSFFTIILKLMMSDISYPLLSTKTKIIKEIIFNHPGDFCIIDIKERYKVELNLTIGINIK